MVLQQDVSRCCNFVILLLAWKIFTARALQLLKGAQVHFCVVPILFRLFVWLSFLGIVVLSCRTIGHCAQSDSARQGVWCVNASCEPAETQPNHESSSQYLDSAVADQAMIRQDHKHTEPKGKKTTERAKIDKGKYTRMWNNSFLILPGTLEQINKPEH